MKPPKMPVNKRESSNSRLVKNEPELKEEVVLEIIEKGDVITPNKVANGIRQKKKISIVPDDTYLYYQLSVDDFLEVEIEVQEVKMEPEKVKTLTIYQQETHDDPEINTY
ncbi:MAG: hypothetical protein M3512_07570 [Bacteroidota bacterium]|nr:hypothetical protein [Bacteroidota bacterium]